MVDEWHEAKDRRKKVAQTDEKPKTEKAKAIDYIQDLDDEAFDTMSRFN